MSFFNDSRTLEAHIFTCTLPFRPAYEYQKSLHHQRVRQNIPDRLLLLEHSPVYTMGKRGAPSDFLTTRAHPRADQADVERIKRGGQTTFHGPGQIVLYIICDLGDKARSIRRYVELLEETAIRYLTEKGIESGRNQFHPGVWVGEKKIAAVGISVAKKTTLHGFALNFRTDLRYFESIIPCGIADRGVCSLESLGLDTNGEIHNEMEIISKIFAKLYGYKTLVLSHHSALPPSTD